MTSKNSRIAGHIDREQVWCVHSTSLNIEYKNYTGDTASFHKSKCQGAEEHIYAHTVANRKYPSHPNYAEHIL
jgi:hypothetical protein